MRGISVSATKRPPNWPKRPCSSGPVRRLLTLDMSNAVTPNPARVEEGRRRSSGSTTRPLSVRGARCLDEGADQPCILLAGCGLDPGRDVDTHGPHLPYCSPDRFRREAPGKHEAERRVKRLQQVPVEGDAMSARPVSTLGGFCIEQQAVGNLGEIVDVGDVLRIADGN